MKTSRRPGPIARAPIVLPSVVAGLLATACVTDSRAPTPGPAPTPRDQVPEPPPPPPKSDAELEQAYARALDAIASTIERKIEAAQTATFDDYETAMQTLQGLLPAANMEIMGQTLAEEGIDAKRLAEWMKAHPEIVEAQTARLEARLAKQEPELERVLTRVAEIAPTDARAAIEAQLAALAGVDVPRPTLDDTPPPPTTTTTDATQQPTEGGWVSVVDRGGLQAAAEQARARGQGLVLDLTAAWCSPCLELDRKILRSPRVAEALQSYGRVRIDVTEPTPAQTELQTLLQAETLPNLLVFADAGVVADALASDGPLPSPRERFTQLPTVEAVLAALGAS